MAGELGPPWHYTIKGYGTTAGGGTVLLAHYDLPENCVAHVQANVAGFNDGDDSGGGYITSGAFKRLGSGACARIQGIVDVATHENLQGSWSVLVTNSGTGFDLKGDGTAGTNHWSWQIFVTIVSPTQ